MLPQNARACFPVHGALYRGYIVSEKFGCKSNAIAEELEAQ
jgi:hypothetical protein